MEDDAWWPRHADGRRKTVGEMTQEERVMVFRKAGETFAKEAVAEEQRREGVPPGTLRN
jgi:hypothetical protein